MIAKFTGHFRSLSLLRSLNSEHAIFGEDKMTEKEIEQKFKADFGGLFPKLKDATALLAAKNSSNRALVAGNQSREYAIPMVQIAPPLGGAASSIANAFRKLI